VDVGARPRLVALALFVVTLALYARTAGFPFVEFDDPGYVRDNPHLAQGLTAESVRWAFTSTEYQYNWHPLTWLSHGLDRELSGLDAGRHHLANAFLHAASAAVLFLALRALTARTWPSALVAALFALHPLRVESVAWVAQRKDVLAGLCFALTLLAYARYVRAPSRGRYAAVAAALAGGLMAKPTVVTLPFLLLVLDGWPLRRLSAGARASSTPAPPRTPSLAPTLPGKGRRAPDGGMAYAVFLEKLPLIALCLGATALTVVAQRAGGALDVEVPLSERVANAGLAYLTYLRQVLVPTGLAVLYPHPALVDPAGSRVAAGALAWLVLAALSVGALALRRRAPWVLAGWLWFLGLLVPMIGLVQVGNQAHADRYAYLAALGIEVALVWSAAELVRARPRLDVPALALAGVWIALLATLSWRQLEHWRGSEALFRRALAVTADNYVAHNNLGQVLGNAGRTDEALAEFEAALRAKPDFLPAELNRGIARHRRGELAAARAAFERTLALDPRHGLARVWLAATLLGEGDPQRADAELARALEDEPALVEHPFARSVGTELARLLDGDAGAR
jgi:tetratricopeptide (TPR) repeat protein